MLPERFPTLSPEEIMVIAGIPTDQLLHTRAAQILLDRGRARRCGPLTGATTNHIQALPLQQLEALADALLDFSGPSGLANWLAEHNG